MKQRRLVVISLDSLGFADLNEQRDLTPNLNRLIAQGTWVKKVRGIFPTLTYPSHTSIITGARRNGSSSKSLYFNYINGFGSCETSYGGRLVAFYLDYSEKMVSSHLDFAA